MLFNYVTDLAEIRKLREEMLVIKKYFLSCQAALECGLLNLLQERQHFKESSDTYSIQDLMDLASGVLIPEINDIHRKFARKSEMTAICVKLKDSSVRSVVPIT